MSIIVVGLNHRSAPLEVRERLALSGTALEQALKALRDARSAESDPPEFAILSTCNRTEIYAALADPDAGMGLIETFLAQMHGENALRLGEYLYRHAGEGAVCHLMRVACGLDSLILGEAEILGQVKAAHEAARSAGTMGAVLSRLFTDALRAGKRARTETPISRYTASVSHAAARLLWASMGGQARVLVIGAGEMARQAAQSLRRFDGMELAFVNRTFERAEALASGIGGRAVPWMRLEKALVWADGILSATSAPHPLISRSDMAGIMAQRGSREMVMVDIAVPRDIEPSAATLAGVTLYGVDDLQSIVDENLERRAAAMPAVESIIANEMELFLAWHHGRQVSPIITELRAWAGRIARDELQQALERLPAADERSRRVVESLTHRLVNRLLHEPTIRLRDQALEGNGLLYSEAVRALFPLDEPPAATKEVAS